MDPVKQVTTINDGDKNKGHLVINEVVTRCTAFYRQYVKYPSRLTLYIQWDPEILFLEDKNSRFSQS